MLKMRHESNFLIFFFFEVRIYIFIFPHTRIIDFKIFNKHQLIDELIIEKLTQIKSCSTNNTKQFQPLNNVLDIMHIN